MMHRRTTSQPSSGHAPSDRELGMSGRRENRLGPPIAFGSSAARWFSAARSLLAARSLSAIPCFLAARIGPSLAVAVLGCGLASVVEQRLVADDVTVAAVAEGFATGLERTSGEQTTTQEEEYELLAGIAAASPRMEYEVFAHSVLGQPIHLVRLGHPTPRGDAVPPAAEAFGHVTGEGSPGPSVLFIGAQHGNEPSGREGALRLIRELAFTDDEALVRQLSEVTVLVIPTANPDGFVADRRRNESGIDTNRDHLQLRTPEARAIARVLQHYRPMIVVDAHESGNPPHKPEETARGEALWPSNLNTPPEIRRLSREMIEDQIFPALVEAGYEARPWRGRAGNPEVLRNALGLRYHLGMVIESFRAVAADRADVQYRTMMEVLAFDRSRRDEVVKAIDQARRSNAEAGGDGSAVVYFRGTEQDPPQEGKGRSAAPYGYLMNAFQLDELTPHRQLFGLEVREIRDGVYFVPMGQPMMTVVPLLLDERGPAPIVTATVVPTADDLDRLEPPPLPPPPSAPSQALISFDARFAPSDAASGSAPASWEPMWRDSQWEVTGPRPRTLKHVVSGGRNRRALVWREAGEIVGDVELATRVRAKSSNTLFQLLLHVSGEAGKENAYYVDARRGDAQVRINRYRDGGFATLASARYEFDPDGWYHLRLRRQGDRLMVRVWADGEPEPAGWTVTTVDATHRQGLVGFGGIEPDSVSEWAFLGLGVGGEPAPMR